MGGRCFVWGFWDCSLFLGGLFCRDVFVIIVGYVFVEGGFLYLGFEVKGVVGLCVREIDG